MADELATRQVVTLLFEMFPEDHIPQKIGLLVLKQPVRLVCCLLFFERPITRVLYREGCSDNQQLFQATAVRRLEQHAADTRIEGQPRKLPADTGHFTFPVDCPDLLEQSIAIPDQALVRRIDEREGRDIPESKQFHLQNDGSEVGALNLGFREGAPALELLLAVETNAYTLGNTPAASLALVGRGLTDELDRQALYLAAMAVPADTRESGVDDMADPGHRQRCFGHVGCQHDSPLARRIEDPGLIRRSQARIERQYLCGVQLVLAQRFSSLANLALSGQKNQDIARLLARQFINCICDRLLHCLITFRDTLFLKWPVAEFYRIRPA